MGPGDEDEEQGRRRKLADRMAKLGGLQFGAPPPVHRPPPGAARAEKPVEGEEKKEETEVNQYEEEGEEDEEARRQRIRAKLAGMGGMRFGMFPPGVPGGPPPPPAKAAPPVEVDAVSEDEGVKVEAEESEIEEVSYEEAEAEAPPPPVPSRSARQATSPPTSARSLPPSGRPPVPSQTAFARKPSLRKSTDSNTAPVRTAPATSEYVMVEEPEEVEELAPPPPPPRQTRAPPPTRAAPPPAPPTDGDASDSLASSQWELPSIPTGSLDLGRGGSGDLSWSEDSTSYHTDTARSSSPLGSSTPLPAETRATGPSTSYMETTLSADQLNLVWGRVGIQVCEAAAELHDKSKKALIGDGTYIGFINAVLSRVPNASQVEPGSSTFGYLIYAQNGGAVQKRTAEIMAGDIIVLQDAKLKGHKGLQSYHQTVGEGGEPLFGIVGEFEGKKHKVKVYQANQHVGHQVRFLPLSLYQSDLNGFL